MRIIQKNRTNLTILKVFLYLFIQRERERERDLKESFEKLSLDIFKSF